MNRLTCLVFASIAILCCVTTAQAQRENTEICFSAGPSFYDLSGTGTGIELDTGFSLRPTSRILVIEPSVAFFTYERDGGERSRWLFYEVSFQAEGRAGRFRPYAGAGFGGGLETVGSDRQSDFVVHLAGGTRIDFGDGYLARVELRLRGIDPWNGSTAFLGFGFGWRF